MTSPVTVAFQPPVAPLASGDGSEKVLPKECKPSVITVDALPVVSPFWSRPNDHLWETEGGRTYVFEWNSRSSNDVRRVSRYTISNLWSLFADTNNTNEMERKAAMCDDLAISMKAFESFCLESFDTQKMKGFKGKLAVLYGDAATRCPSWHADYVPVRWIQTFCGPGTMYVDPQRYKQSESVLQQIIEGAHRRKGREWKDQQLHEAGIEPEQAEPGQAVLLVGHRWKDLTRLDKNYDQRPPVVHRSPRNVPNGQPRVILTMDVELGEEECTKGCCDHDH